MRHMTQAVTGAFAPATAWFSAASADQLSASALGT